MHNLTWLIAIPFLLSAGAFTAPRINARLFKRIAFGASLLPLALLAVGGGGWIGEEIYYAWIPALHVNFHLRVDELSLIFLFLTALVIPISLCAVSSRQQAHPEIFYGLVFLLEGLLFSFFSARDLALFTFFWEAMLIPLYLMINLSGGENRQVAALKFLIYMIAGSCLMVAGVLFLFFSSAASTFDIEALSKVAAHSPYAAVACAIFLLAFAVKTPLFPFHAWLPDAYCQASMPATILLSAILSKAGIYGILRVGLPFFPDLIIAWSPLLLGLAIAGVLYGALAAWRQTDYKRLIAYSSFSHVNFVLAGLFVWSQVSHEGAILQAVNHGITIAALFTVAGWLEKRIGTTSIGAYAGLAKYLPALCWVTLVFVLSSVAMPGTNNFVGELLILFGLFTFNPWLAAILGTTVILSVIYMLRWMQKVYFETPSAFQSQWIDLRPKEFAIALPLIALILWIGIYPTPLFRHIEPAAERILAAAQPKESQ